MLARLTSASGDTTTESTPELKEHRRSASTSSGISSLQNRSFRTPNGAPLTTIQSNDSKEYVRDEFTFDTELFLDNKHYADFTLKIGAETIGVSSIVLAANSAYIKELVEVENIRELTLDSIDADYNQIWEMVKPLYNGKIILRSDNLWAYVMFTTKFHIDWMFDSCVSYFNENITPTLVFKMVELSLRPTNSVQPRYIALLALCQKYLEEGQNMADICTYVQDNGLIEKLSKEVVLYLSKIASPNLIELVGVILIWLKLDEGNMGVVPELLEVFDFSEVFKMNEELAEDFFTHIITGDYPVATRKRIMNLSLQSCKHIQRSHKGNALSRRKSRLKSNSNKEAALREKKPDDGFFDN